jgi:hypothetical protein
MNTKEQIFNEAYNDRLSVRITTPDSVSLIFRGVKIENKDDNIKIYNLAKGGDFYKEVTPKQYKVFADKGFRQGVYEVCMENYKDTLKMLSVKICNEVASRNNQKHYNSLKEYRTTIMNKISEVIKLKQI